MCDFEKLTAPFRPDEIEWRVQRTVKVREGHAVIVVPYVTNRAIQDRLDEVFTPFGWQDQYMPWKGKGQLCGISVYTGSEWITKWDGADDTNIEPTKGGLSDSEKRAAVKWGIGRYLYKLDEQRVPVKERGENWIKTKVDNEEVKGYWDTPKLPEWALPTGTNQQQSVIKEIHVKTEIQDTQEDIKPKCADCGKKISVAEHDYSTKNLKRPLCRPCQDKVKQAAS